MEPGVELSRIIPAPAHAPPPHYQHLPLQRQVCYSHEPTLARPCAEAVVYVRVTPLVSHVWCIWTNA